MHIAHKTIRIQHTTLKLNWIVVELFKNVLNLWNRNVLDFKCVLIKQNNGDKKHFTGYQDKPCVTGDDRVNTAQANVFGYKIAHLLVSLTNSCSKSDMPIIIQQVMYIMFKTCKNRFTGNFGEQSCPVGQHAN